MIESGVYYYSKSMVLVGVHYARHILYSTKIILYRTITL